MTNDTTTAPAPAADAATGERGATRLTTADVDAMDRHAEACQPHDVRALAADWRRLEAERDRLALEVAALNDDAEIGREYMEIMARWAPDAWWDTSPLEWMTRAMDEWEDANAALKAENAALRGAMPLPNTSDAKTLEGLDTIEARAKRVIADTDADSDRNDCGHHDRRRFLAADILRLVRLARFMEAERDRLSAEVAALRQAKDAFDAARNAALDRAERAEAEAAALRGAMPDPDQLVSILSDDEDGPARAFARLERLEATIRALSATPPAAEAVTGGGEVWGREAPAEPGQYWCVLSRDGQPELVYIGSNGVFRNNCSPAGPWDCALYGPPVTPPDGWREALAALDQDQLQEADHAQ